MTSEIIGFVTITVITAVTIGGVVRLVRIRGSLTERMVIDPDYYYGIFSGLIARRRRRGRNKTPHWRSLRHQERRRRKAAKKRKRSSKSSR
jgi:hypothetical protein